MGYDKSRNPNGRPARPIAERFWEKVNQREDDDCWEWLGATQKSKWPYGLFKATRRKMRYAHIVAYELSKGDTNGLFVCHSCDNPKCCNPKHLFLGTPKINAEDMVSKERQTKGEGCHSHKLTDEQVIEMRNLYKTGQYSKAQLARKFNVSNVNAGDIINGNTWKHLL